MPRESRAAMPPYPMAPAPTGFKWRMLTPTIDQEISLPLSYIAGRYYPEIICSPIVADVFNSHTLQACIENNKLRKSLNSPLPLTHGDAVVQRLLSLAGLMPGIANPSECEQWAASRLQMFTKGEKESKAEVFAFWRDQSDVPVVDNSDQADVNSYVKTEHTSEDDEEPPSRNIYSKQMAPNWRQVSPSAPSRKKPRRSKKGKEVDFGDANWEDGPPRLNDDADDDDDFFGGV